MDSGVWITRQKEKDYSGGKEGQIKCVFSMLLLVSFLDASPTPYNLVLFHYMFP